MAMKPSGSGNDEPVKVPGTSDAPARRRFFRDASRAAMAAGLISGYGMFGAIAARYLFSSNSDDGEWQFVTIADRLEPGRSMNFEAPNGERINVMRQAGEVQDDGFRALSSTCPHLGCQVHWESQNERFFCPCHNGVFDPSGLGVSGPPEGQSLARYPLRIEKGLLFVRVPTVRLISMDSADTKKAEG